MADHNNRAHALLSASGSYRWLNCTPSARLEEKFPDTTSEAALEGTLAHEMCELKAREKFQGEDLLTGLDLLREDHLYQYEMETYTNEYVDFIDKQMMSYKLSPYLMLEESIDLSAYIPDGFGSCDAIIIGDTTIEVIDFKYGKGVPVSAENNPQMMLYALGAYEKYRLLFGFNTVRMTIVQPRIDNTNSWECSLDELKSFGEVVKKAAKMAYEGRGIYAPGDWCRFCRARAVCRARADQSIKLAFGDDFGKSPDLIDNSEIGKYLEMGTDVAKWVEELKAYALSECLEGREVEGYKAVAGRSSRNFADMDKAFEILQANGIDEAMLYERKPLTVAKLEKTIGKKTFNEMIGDYIVKTDGKPTLVPETDKRKAINSVENAFK